MPNIPRYWMTEERNYRKKDKKIKALLVYGPEYISIGRDNVESIIPYDEQNGDTWYAVYSKRHELLKRINSRYVSEVSYE